METQYIYIHHIKNSAGFARKITKSNVNPEDLFVSFDVKNQFIQLAGNRGVLSLSVLSASSYCPLIWRASLVGIVKLLTVCLSSTYFQFANSCEQTSGTDMGSPLSPVIANLYMYMEHFKQITCLRIDHLQTQDWLRYVA